MESCNMKQEEKKSKTCGRPFKRELDKSIFYYVYFDRLSHK